MNSRQAAAIAIRLVVDGSGTGTTRNWLPGSEKAAPLYTNDVPTGMPGYEGEFAFNADGASFSRAQQHAQAAKQQRYYAARRAPGTITLIVQAEPLALEEAEEA